MYAFVMKPGWWIEFSDFVQMPTWIIFCGQAGMILVSGPFRACANYKLWVSQQFCTFLEPIRDGGVDDIPVDTPPTSFTLSTAVRTNAGAYRFSQEFQSIDKENGIDKLKPEWFLGFVVLPASALWLISAPHWQLVSVVVLLPMYLKDHLVRSLDMPFEVALAASRFRAKNVISKLKDQAAIQHEPNTPLFWHAIAVAHQKFDEDLSHLWEVACFPIAIVAAEGWGASFALALMGLDTPHDVASIVLFTVATSIALFVVLLLKPMADTTALCQNLGLGEYSIRKAASQYVGMMMSSDATAEYLKFTAHLDRTPTGVSVPVIGQVSYAFLASKAVLIATVIPTALTFARVNLPHALDLNNGTIFVNESY